jgi:hypothetical protein
MNRDYRAFFVVCLSLLALPFVIPRPVHADAPSPAATLTTGEWWKYDLQFANLPGAPVTLAGTLTETLGGEQSINVKGIVYDTLRFDESGSGTVSGVIAGYSVSGTWTLYGSDYKQKSDLSELQSAVTFQINLQTVIPSGSVSVTVTLTQSTSHTPPDETYRFPLAVGESWVSSSLVSTNTTTTIGNQPPVTNSTSATSSETLNVLSVGITTVPVGSYQTYLVEDQSQDDSRSDHYYSPQVENDVKMVSYNSTGYQIVTQTLSDYSAWSYRTNESVQTNGKTYNILVASDAATSNIHATALSLTFQVSGPDGTTGKALLVVDRGLNGTDLQVLVDSRLVTTTITENSTSYQVAFTLSLSTHIVTLIYANQTFFASLLSNFFWYGIIIGTAIIVAVVLIAVLVVRRRRPAQPGQTPAQTPAQPLGPPPVPPTTGPPAGP